MKLDLLLGRVVRQIFMEAGEGRMRFVCEDGDNIEFVTDGDCCSETWFADIVGVTALIGHPITIAEEVEVPELLDGRCRQESDSFYGFRMFTQKGCCDAIYRNSSNGYYGGDCTLLVNGAGERWGSRFTLPGIDATDWKEITEDFSA
ncbi:UNVERIFIED_ORG: hypothetical protein ABIC54_004411 [Burkholderia sp. 1263]